MPSNKYTNAGFGPVIRETAFICFLTILTIFKKLGELGENK